MTVSPHEGREYGVERVTCSTAPPRRTWQVRPASRSKSIFNSKWEGSVLVTTIVLPMATRIEKRSIQADGTMKNEVTFNFKDGRSETGWMVFNKGDVPLRTSRTSRASGGYPGAQPVDNRG